MNTTEVSTVARDLDIELIFFKSTDIYLPDYCRELFGLDPDLRMDWIYLAEFHNNGEYKGAGSIALKALCEYADEHQYPIVLNAFGNADWRVFYYHRFGFLITHYLPKGWCCLMKRQPRRS